MLTFISPALISRVYAAFDQDQRERALTLLRQAFLTHRQGHAVADNDFICELEQQASKAVQRCEFERAEQLYRLALDLYEKCFPNQHMQAICCFGGLAKAVQAQPKEADLRELLYWDDLILQRVREAEQRGTVVQLFADHHSDKRKSA